MGKISTGWWSLLTCLEYVPLLTLTPRLILNVRALHARQLRGRCGTRDIDSEFGLTLGYGRNVREATLVLGSMGPSEEDGLERDEEIQMSEIGGGASE